MFLLILYKEYKYRLSYFYFEINQHIHSPILQYIVVPRTVCYTALPYITLYGLGPFLIRISTLYLQYEILLFAEINFRRYLIYVQEFYLKYQIPISVTPNKSTLYEQRLTFHILHTLFICSTFEFEANSELKFVFLW